MSQNFIAFIDNADAERAVQHVIDAHWPDGTIIGGGVDSARQAQNSSAGTPANVIIDISNSSQPELDAAELVDKYADAKSIILLGRRNDVQFYRQMVQMGASDYLVIPFAPDDLYQAIASAATASSSAEIEASGDRQAKLITVMGANGGVGTSMLSVNLAWILAEEFNRKVTIVDLDVHFGTVALSLDLEPSIGFTEALESPGRVDNLFIENILVKATNNLTVLAAEESLDEYVTYNNTSIELLIETLKASRDYVFIDTPRSILRRCPPVVDDAEMVILLAELTVAGLRDVVTILGEIRKISPYKEVKIVINRKREKGRGEVPLRDFEKEIEKEVSLVIPDAPDIVASALNNGKAIVSVNSSSDIANSLREFCQFIEDGPAEVSSNKSFLSKIFSK